MITEVTFIEISQIGEMFTPGFGVEDGGAGILHITNTGQYMAISGLAKDGACCPYVEIPAWLGETITVYAKGAANLEAEEPPHYEHKEVSVTLTPKAKKRTGLLYRDLKLKKTKKKGKK